MKFIKENIRVVIAVLVSIVLIITGVILLTVEQDNNEDPNNNNETNKEQQITDITGMTGKDAIDIVKKNFYSDNYEFSAEVTNDSLYRVIATNIVDNSQIIYFVDPSNGNAYIDIDTN